MVIATLICVLPDCSSAQQPRANAEPLFGGKKVLIVYLSRTNNTKAIAEFIHQRVGGSIVAIELERPYPADYNATVQQVARENETGYLPPLKTTIDRIEQYDVVLLGFPTWGMQLPPPRPSAVVRCARGGPAGRAGRCPRPRKYAAVRRTAAGATRPGGCEAVTQIKPSNRCTPQLLTVRGA
ncbi:MAG TPA: hypothetical protein VNQ14_03155 [Woeseiaceae bacterium]|nr:hypothetical protein [Woeseiaceae bacterium]